MHTFYIENSISLSSRKFRVSFYPFLKIVTKFQLSRSFKIILFESAVHMHAENYSKFKSTNSIINASCNLWKFIWKNFYLKGPFRDTQPKKVEIFCKTIAELSIYHVDIINTILSIYLLNCHKIIMLHVGSRNWPLKHL